MILAAGAPVLDTAPPPGEDEKPSAHHRAPGGITRDPPRRLVPDGGRHPQATDAAADQARLAGGPVPPPGWRPSPVAEPHLRLPPPHPRPFSARQRPP